MHALQDLHISSALNDGLNGVQITLALHDQQITLVFDICDELPTLYDSSVGEKAMQNPSIQYRRFWRVGVQTSVYVICVGFPRHCKSPNFHVHLSVNDLLVYAYSQDRSAYFAAAK